MEESWGSDWFCDLEVAGDCSFILEENFESCFSTTDGVNMSDSSSSFERPSKLLHMGISNSNSVDTHHHLILSSQNQNSYAQVDSAFTLKNKAPLPSKGYLQSQRNKVRETQEGKKSSSVGRRSPHAHDHIIAERMRREKITQHFIALSALIPGLKRVDKASVLEEAIKYVKHLQEQVKKLEEQIKKKNEESVPVVFVKKSLLSADEHVVSDTSSNNSMDENFHDPLKYNAAMAEAEVEARVSHKNVLIRIQCQKQKRLVVKIITEIEKLHLSVVNSSVMPFGSSILDITIIAEMQEEFKLSVEELARNLRVALLQLM